MAIIEYEDEIKELVNKDNHDEFIYDFLSIYDKISKATITKLRKGTNNLAKNPGEVYLKNKIYFKYADNDVLGSFSKVENYVDDISSKPRYIIVTDYNRLLAKDTKTKDSLDIEFTQLPKYFEFFLAWNGIEKADFEKENPADIKAAEYLARIYDQLLKDNENVSRHGFNLFLIRLLFCLFAEDTGIFKENSFTDFLKMMTADDGSDMNERISELFEFLDKKIRSADEPAYLLEFPYVNGQLFTNPHEKIIFTKETRKSIIDAGELIGWSKVNPDILGSMLQAVASEEQRSHLGMHYTSVPNIMKVIKPLFLNELREEFENSKGNEDKLNSLYNRIGKIKFMDPACGSGNFLIITYKELRQLEIDIISEINKMGIATMYIPSVTLNQFYGIEIDDFACDVTRLSLWIAEHQMNKKLEEEIDNAVRPTLPLQKAGAIICGNALREDWNTILSNSDVNETYIFGNPPYIGARKKDKNQKEDLRIAFENKKGINSLDYVAGWFYKGFNFIKNKKSEFAFVSTNSICQGEQVGILWKEMIFRKENIKFAYPSFKWTNNAKNNAGIIVSIIGLRNDDGYNRDKYLFKNNKMYKVRNISPYLTDNDNIIVNKKSKRNDGLPQMSFGNMPNDNGNFIFSEEEFKKIPLKSRKFFKKLVGSKEFITNEYRYCLWLYGINEDEYKDDNFIKEIIKKVYNYRKNSKREATRKLSIHPERFGEVRWKPGQSIVIPRVSSESRIYIPIGILNSDVIISDSAMAVYNAPLWLLGVLESRMHMVWLRNIGGKLGNGSRYSISLVYNTFPIPELSLERKRRIEALTLDILDIRDEEGGSMSDLYGSPLSKINPKPMNQRLLNAHKKLDQFIDSLYKSKVINNDSERLSILLNLYRKKVGK